MLDNENKITIKHRERNINTGLSDSMGISGDKYEPSLKGKVVFKDPNGNVLFTKDNLVVFRGRLFVLEKVFNKSLPDSADSNYIRNANRRICLFKVGEGGTLVDDPFNPLIVNPLERDLANPTPFRTVITGIGDGLDDDEVDKYFGAETSEGAEGTQTDYYLKRICVNNQGYEPMMNIFPDTNTINIQCDLVVDKYDCRDTKINELGLFMAEESSDENGNTVFNDIEMVSRITFDTESLKDNKSVTVEYYIYV